ncbi:hypothetical protein Trydic_g20513 [Trypoxylus dichotomus]
MPLFELRSVHYQRWPKAVKLYCSCFSSAVRSRPCPVVNSMGSILLMTASALIAVVYGSERSVLIAVSLMKTLRISTPRTAGQGCKFRQRILLEIARKEVDLIASNPLPLHWPKLGNYEIKRRIFLRRDPLSRGRESGLGLGDVIYEVISDTSPSIGNQRSLKDANCKLSLLQNVATACHQK